MQSKNMGEKIEDTGSATGIPTPPIIGANEGLKGFSDESGLRTIGLVATTTAAQDLLWINDPQNPRNWSTAKKIYHILVPSLFGFVVYAKKTCSSNFSQLTSCIQFSWNVLHFPINRNHGDLFPRK